MDFMDDTQLLTKGKKKKTKKQKLMDWDQQQKPKPNFNEILLEKFNIDILHTLKKLELDENQLEFSSVIGSGGFAKVYRGTCCVDHKVVAIKCIHSHKLLERSTIDRIQREVVFMNLVKNHPNFLNLIGVVFHSSKKLIVTELVEGNTLYDIIHGSDGNLPKLSWKDSLYISHQIAEGMNYLHHICQPNLVHRDLKSDNILISIPDLSIVKIIDFGCVIPHEMMDQFNNPTGTIRWMAPEMLRTEHCTSKIDIFSFGIVMWELLVQKQPYHNLDPLQITDKVGKEASGIRPEIPEKIFDEETMDEIASAKQRYIALMKKCWAEDPEQRPSFKQIAAELRDLIGSEE